MNYIKEINSFYDWLETNSVSDSAITLWHALMHVNNKTGWKEEFAVASSTLQVKTGLSISSLKRARNNLAQAGIIKWKQRSGNQSAIYQIISFAVHIEPQAVPQSELQSEPQTVPQSEPINKLNKTKQKRDKYLFVQIKDFDSVLKNFNSDFEGKKEYFLIAYRFWSLWWSDNQTKTLKDANIWKWVESVRLIIENDKQQIDRLIAVLEYFKKCQVQESGFRTFWFETIKSIGAFRKKDKQDVYYLDKIMEDVNKKIQTDMAFKNLVFGKIQKFKEDERFKLHTEPY